MGSFVVSVDDLLARLAEAHVRHRPADLEGALATAVADTPGATVIFDERLVDHSTVLAFEIVSCRGVDVHFTPCERLRGGAGGKLIAFS